MNTNEKKQKVKELDETIARMISELKEKHERLREIIEESNSLKDDLGISVGRATVTRTVTESKSIEPKESKWNFLE